MKKWQENCDTVLGHCRVITPKLYYWLVVELESDKRLK